MRIGIIAEGHADRAVIENVISGLTGLDNSCFIPLRPSDLKDETDKAKNPPASFGSWTHVRKECQERKLIDLFLVLDDNEFIAIHIDSAEAHLYNIQKPVPKSNRYCQVLRELIVEKINEWLAEDMQNVILYAIAIEEIDAWILALKEDRDSSSMLDAKRRLSRLLSKNNINSTSSYENYQLLSKDFSKAKSYRTNIYLDRNCSLAAFCEEIITKVVPKIN